MPIFVNLLLSEQEDVQEQAIWALGNIAGDSPECRDYVLEQGILNPLLQLLTKSTRLSMTRNAVWALSNLCRGKNPPPDFSKVKSKIFLFIESKTCVVRCLPHCQSCLDSCSTVTVMFWQTLAGLSRISVMDPMIRFKLS